MLKIQFKKEWMLYIIISLVILITGICNHNTNDFFGKTLATGETAKQDTAIMKTTVLEPGAYTLVIDYATSSDQNYVTVFSEIMTDSNNQKGVVFAKGVLKHDAVQILLPIQIDNLCYDATVTISSKDGEIEIKNMEIISEKSYFSDALFLMLLSLLLLFGMAKILKRGGTVVVLIATAMFASLPLFNDFLIASHDITYHLAHIDGIYQGIINGELPVRVNSLQTYGYGYAMPTMYPNFFLYIPALLRVGGVSLLLSYKSFIVLINIATALVAYTCFKNLLRSERAAMFGSVIYTLSAYRLVNIYERGALGEVIAMTFLPLALWGMYEVIKGNKKKWIWLSVGYAGVIMSHVISSFLLVLFSIVAVIFLFPSLWRDKTRIYRLLLAAVTTVGMVVWFVIPMLSYLRLPFNVLVENKGLHDSALYLFQMFSGVWGTEYRLDIGVGKTLGEMPLTVGPIMAIGIVCFLYLYGKKTKKDTYLFNLGKGFLLIGGCAVFMASWIFPWEAFQKIEIVNQVFSKIQYAMRFLMPATLFLSIVAAIAIHIFLAESKGEEKRGETFVLLGIFLISGIFLQGTMEKETFINKSVTTATLDCDNLYYYQGTNTDIWKNNGEQIQALGNANIQISEYEKRGTTITFYANIEEIEENAYFDLPLAYYPGYEASIDKEMLEVSRSENGMVRVNMPEYSGKIEVSFEDKPLWIVGNITSFVIWGIVGIYGVLAWRRRGGKHENKIFQK